LILPVFKVLSIKIGKEVRIKPDSCVLLDECEEEIQEEEIEEEKDNLDFFEEE
jgi:NAD-dependent dihydropyrimidine dehydrogenase PreA subunit